MKVESNFKKLNNCDLATKRLNISLPEGHSAVSWGSDNPSPWIYPNGTVLMLSRKYNGTRAKAHEEPHDTIWLIRAPSFRGPYELVFDRPVFANETFNEEDPCLWCVLIIDACILLLVYALSLQDGPPRPLPRSFPFHPWPRLVRRWIELALGRRQEGMGHEHSWS